MRSKNVKKSQSLYEVDVLFSNTVQHATRYRNTHFRIIFVPFQLVLNVILFMNKFYSNCVCRSLVSYAHRFPFSNSIQSPASFSDLEFLHCLLDNEETRSSRSVHMDFHLRFRVFKAQRDEFVSGFSNNSAINSSPVLYSPN